MDASKIKIMYTGSQGVPNQPARFCNFKMSQRTYTLCFNLSPIILTSKNSLKPFSTLKTHQIVIFVGKATEGGLGLPVKRTLYLFYFKVVRIYLSKYES